jgi:hypothetical protein
VGVYGLDNCSFRNKKANPTTIMIWQNRQTQNSQYPKGLLFPLCPTSQIPGLGNAFPGPTFVGEVARAIMTVTEPMNCARARVAQTCNRERVWSRIIPKPAPWIASSTPSHNHSPTPLFHQHGLMTNKNKDLHVRSGSTCPWDVNTHSRSTPPDLTPPGCSETDSKDRYKPRVDLGVFCQSAQSL